MHSHRANFVSVSAQERLFVVVRIVQCFVRIVQDALYSTAHFRARTFEGSARQPIHTLGDLAARTSRCVTIPVHFSLCVRRPSRTAGKQLSVGVSCVCGVGVVLHCAIATLCHINASPRASTQYESHVLHAKLKASVFYTLLGRTYSVA